MSALALEDEPVKIARRPENEGQRIVALRRYGILDTPAEAAFDELTSLAGTLCGTPIAFIGFIDERRQWFKSRSGVDFTEVPRDLAFCSHAILGEKPLVAEDVG